MTLAQKIRTEIPDISLTTDIIVGFPGETEEDLSETIDVCEKVRFDAAYTFIYSKRTGTPAASFDDQVPEDVIKDRFERLLAVQNRIVEENLQKMKGLTVPVLFEEVSGFDASLVTGRTEGNMVVHVPGGKELIGKIKNVTLTDPHGFYYMGVLHG